MNSPVYFMVRNVTSSLTIQSIKLNLGLKLLKIEVTLASQIQIELFVIVILSSIKIK